MSAHLYLGVASTEEFDATIFHDAPIIASAIEPFASDWVTDEGCAGLCLVAPVTAREAAPRNVQLTHFTQACWVEGFVKHMEALVRHGLAIGNAAPVLLYLVNLVPNRPDRGFGRAPKAHQPRRGVMLPQEARQLQWNPVARQHEQSERERQ